MLGYCMKCKKKMEMSNTKIIQMKNGVYAITGICSECGTKIFRINKRQEEVSRSAVEREEALNIIAYHIWEEEGCPNGKDVEHWLKAEAIWKENQNK